MAAAPRVLLSGDVLGRLNQVFKRVASVNKSAGPFDALLCVGQFFPESPDQLEELNDYIEGRSQIPIPTYFIGDYGVGSAKVLSVAAKNSANLGFKMDGLKVCENLFWLRGGGKFTLHGLSVVYLSGRQSASVQQFGTYSQDDVDSLRAFSEEHGIVDLFLTNEWPKGVTNRAAASEVTSGMLDSSTGDSTISDLVSEIQPRYHIAGTVGVYYDREPYVNVGAVHVTRFLALGSVGNKNKQCFRSKECWFCLSSPSVESHLITSIGEDYYCALAKGPLVQDHVLIIPIEHVPSTLSLPPECETRLSRFQSSLKAYFKSQEKVGVFFEWISKRGTHANLQAVPIPSSRATSVKDIFNLAAKKLGFKFTTVENDNSSEGRKLLQTHLDKNQSLFYVEAPGGTFMSHVIEENEKFPVQFGREVLAGLLNIADKADWRNCQLSKDEETKMADSFKSRFEEYNPNS